MKPQIQDLRRVAPVARALAIAAVAILFGFAFLSPSDVKVAADNRNRTQAPDVLGTVPPTAPTQANCPGPHAGYSWGVVLASGELSFTGNTVTAGLMYAPGTISRAGTVGPGEESGGGCW